MTYKIELDPVDLAADLWDLADLVRDSDRLGLEAAHLAGLDQSDLVEAYPAGLGRLDLDSDHQDSHGLRHIHSHGVIHTDNGQRHPDSRGEHRMDSSALMDLISSA